MTHKHSHEQTAAEAETKQGRRSFLIKSVAGGVGASLVLHGAAPAQAQFDVACDVQASPLEALLSQKDILNLLQAALYRHSIKDIGGAVEKTTDFFGELCAKVASLKVALVATRKGADYERMKALAEVGCASVSQMQNFSDAGRVQVQLSALNGLSEQIRKIAYELLPEGQGVTLDAEATRILRELIILIDDQTGRVRQQLQATLAQSRRVADEYELATDRIQTLLSAAINEMYKANSAVATAALVAQAGDELRKLRGKLREAAFVPEGETAELLIALTDGTRQWIAGTNAASAGATTGPDIFRKAAYRPAPARAVSAIAAGELSGLIYNYYPPEGYFKAGKCLLLLTQLKLWAKLQTVSRAEAVEMVKRGLSRLSIACSAYQGRECQAERFIQELANIILR